MESMGKYFEGASAPICGHCDKPIDGEVGSIPECCDKPICEACIEAAAETERENAADDAAGGAR